MKRVFVVEDHPVMREMLAILIDRQPGLVLCGESGTARDALDAIPESDPDVVLVDVSLPGMSGIDLVEQIRAQKPELLTLVISGHEESVYAEQALRAGARGYVMKGDPGEIMRAIGTVLAGGLCFSARVRQTLQL